MKESEACKREAREISGRMHMLMKSPQKRKAASEAANGWTRVSSLLKLERRERDELGALLGVKNDRCCF